MFDHRVRVVWERGSGEFTYETYDRTHAWIFEGGTRLEASSAPDFLGRPECVDPEEAFTASVSSCHMLTFLALAARRRFVVDGYTDDALGHLDRNEEGRLAVTRVVLRPRITWSGEKQPDDAEVDRLHERAHHHCFIANSVRSEIVVQAREPS